MQNIYLLLPHMLTGRGSGCEGCFRQVSGKPGSHLAAIVSSEPPGVSDPFAAREPLVGGMWYYLVMSGLYPDLLVGRHEELIRLSKLVRDVAVGCGAVVLVEGEPGVGKTAVVESAINGGALARCQVLRTNGNPLTEPLPLRMILKCLRVEDLPGDPERAELSALLRSDAPGAAGVLSGDRILAAVERVIVLIERMSATAPVILVLDDLQWADDTTLHLCQRLTSMINQLPLLLVGVCRPVPRRPGLNRLRQCHQRPRR